MRLGVGGWVAGVRDVGAFWFGDGALRAWRWAFGGWRLDCGHVCFQFRGLFLGRWLRARCWPLSTRCSQHEFTHVESKLVWCLTVPDLESELALASSDFKSKLLLYLFKLIYLI